MSETDNSVSAAKAPKSLSKRLIAVTAVIVGVFGALGGDARYEFKAQVSKETVSEEVVVGCKVVRSLPSDFRPPPDFQSSLEFGATIPWIDCGRLSADYLGPYLELVFETETREENVEKRVRRRDWSAEVVSRGLRFMIGATFGALFTFGLLSLRLFSRLKNFATSSISQIQKSVTTTIGGKVMTTDPVQSPPQAGATKNQRRKGFDVRFEEFVTPMIVSIFYVFCVVVAFLAGFVYWFSTISDFSEDSVGSRIITALWSAPLIFGAVMIVVLVLRLIFETVAVRFRIADDLKKIREKLVQ